MPQADVECVICAPLRDGKPHNGSVVNRLRVVLSKQGAER